MKNCSIKFILSVVMLTATLTSFAQSSDMNEDYRFKNINGFTKFVWHEFQQEVQKDTSCTRGFISIELKLNEQKNIDSIAISPGLPHHLNEALYQIVNNSEVYWQDYFHTSGESVPDESIIQLVYFDIRSGCIKAPYRPTTPIAPSVFSLFRDENSKKEGFGGFWNSSEMPLKGLILGPAICYVSRGFNDLNPKETKD